MSLMFAMVYHQTILPSVLGMEIVCIQDILVLLIVSVIMSMWATIVKIINGRVVEFIGKNPVCAPKMDNVFHRITAHVTMGTQVMTVSFLYVMVKVVQMYVLVTVIAELLNPAPVMPRMEERNVRFGVVMVFWRRILLFVLDTEPVNRMDNVFATTAIIGDRNVSGGCVMVGCVRTRLVT
ncbi:MAG: hypothetical protein ACTSUE_14045 [Promethearchaeota archaeon]